MFKKREPLDLAAARELLRGATELAQNITANGERTDDQDTMLWWQIQMRLINGRFAEPISTLHWHLQQFPEDTAKKEELDKLTAELVADAESECERLKWQWPQSSNRPPSDQE